MLRWLFTCLFLAACALPSRMLIDRTGGPTLGWKAEDERGVSMVLDRVVIRDGAGSWVREAGWDEYSLTIRNDSDEAIRIVDVEISSTVVPSARHLSSADALEGATSGNLRELASSIPTVAIAGIGAGVGVVTALGSGAGVLGGTAAASPAVMVLPILPFAVGGVLVARQSSRGANDNAIIQHELERRAFRFPMALGSHRASTGSAFFPITPAPSTLRLEYDRSGRRSLMLDVSALRLYVAPTAVGPP